MSNRKKLINNNNKTVFNSWNFTPNNKAMGFKMSNVLDVE